MNSELTSNAAQYMDMSLQSEDKDPASTYARPVMNKEGLSGRVLHGVDLLLNSWVRHSSSALAVLSGSVWSVGLWTRGAAGLIKAEPPCASAVAQRGPAPPPRLAMHENDLRGK